MTTSDTPPISPRALAAIDLLRRTGSNTFELRYSDDQTPIVWMAIAGYQLDKHGRPVASGGRAGFEVAAALDPEAAVYRLCDQVVDGGTCTHCHRPTGFAADLDAMPLAAHLCWYQWDPELRTFRRGCEGR